MSAIEVMIAYKFSKQNTSKRKDDITYVHCMSDYMYMYMDILTD